MIFAVVSKNENLKESMNTHILQKQWLSLIHVVHILVISVFFDMVKLLSISYLGKKVSSISVVFEGN